MQVRKTVWMDKEGEFHSSVDRGAYADRRLLLIMREGGTLVSVSNVD